MPLIRIDGYPMDLAISEGFKFPGEVTQFPTESGSPGNDHILDLPHEITFEGVVSNTPSGEVATDSTRRGSDQTNEQPLPSVEALARLREIKARRRPIAIETSFGTFESMAFVNLDVKVDKETGTALFFTAEFSFFNVITNKRTRVPVSTPLAGAGGKAKSKRVIGKGMVVDAGITWRHGVPPGAPFKEGNLVEQIGVVYGQPSGVSRETAVVMQRERPGSRLVTYVYGEGPLEGQPIQGIPRINLIADLERDNKLKALEQTKALNTGAAATKPALPPGYDLSRIKRSPDDFVKSIPKR